MEKSYLDHMESITSEELYRGLLGYGLFGEKLPPIFSSIDFYEWCIEHPNFLSSSECTEYIYYESIRNVNIPRQLGLPGPFSYARLCKVLSEYWAGELQSYFRLKTENNNYKISRVHIRKLENSDAIFEMNYKKESEDVDPIRRLSIGKKYVVKSDIKSCYPSIYSHALSWALVGKEEAKRNSRNYALWFNKIDQCVRNVKYGETNGILIGPHASNILSEIILVSVDDNLYRAGYKFIRNIDDYYCVTETYEEAESFIKDLVSALKDYNLSVNQSKTKILNLPLYPEDEWVHILGVPPIVGPYGVVEIKSVKAYLNQALQLMQNHNGDAAPIKYATKVLKSLNVSDKAKDYIVDTILHWAIIYPYLVPLLQEFIFDCYRVSSDLIREFISILYKDSIIRRNYEGVAYALFFSIKYDIEIESFDMNNLLRGDSICKLLSFLYCKKFRHRNEQNILKEHAQGLMEFNFNENWIFIYEILNQEELRGRGLWSNLKNQGISFIKSEYR